MKRALMVFTVLAVGAGLCNSQILIRVPQDQPTIQAGINAASNGDTVLVSEGTYLENIKINKKIILGSLYVRDGDTSHISRTIINGSGATNLDSAATISVAGSTDTTLVIVGFTITGGKGNNIDVGWSGGGGIEISRGGARISHNIITANTLGQRTGISNTYGGGISVWSLSGYSYVIIEDNVISNNTVSGSYAEGAGIATANALRLEHNRIENNRATGITNGYGGGISIYADAVASFVLSANMIRGNVVSHRGGAVYLYGHAYASMTNNVIVQNSANWYGGAIFESEYSNLILVQNTIALNYAGGPGSGLFEIGSNYAATSAVRGINNIFWDRGPYPNEIFGADFESLHHNLIRGESSFGDGNFSADPGFADTVSFELSSGSPCIAAGTTSKLVLGNALVSPPTDYYGHERPRAGGTAADLGAIESEFSDSPGTPRNRVEVGKFMFGGIMRYYVLVGPRFTPTGAKFPVLMNLHGYGGHADWEMNYCQTQLVDTAGFLTVYPEAVARRWNSGISGNADYPTPAVNDSGFISALIDTLGSRDEVDKNRIFVCGYSNGGFMSLRLAAQLGDKIAGAASVVGVNTDAIPAVFDDARYHPMPILLINGTLDPEVPYSGKPYFHSVDSTVNFWRAKNSCTTLAQVDTINADAGDNCTVIRYTYTSAANSSKVVLLKVVGGGHAWPGSPPEVPPAGVTTRDIDANTEIVRFFRDYGLTGVEDRKIAPPLQFHLSQNYPNPFNPNTTIRFSLTTRSHVKLAVYNLLGQVVATLVDEEIPAGVHEVPWNAAGSSGVYFYRLEAIGVDGKRYVETRRMVLLR